MDLIREGERTVTKPRERASGVQLFGESEIRSCVFKSAIRFILDVRILDRVNALLLNEN